MPDRVGAALDLTGPIATLPAVLHYQNGPVCYYHHIRHGESHLVICRAHWDGIGWLVYQVQLRSLVIDRGAICHFRFPIVEHLGDRVMVEVRDERGLTLRQLPTKAIVYVEEPKPPERARDTA